MQGERSSRRGPVWGGLVACVPVFAACSAPAPASHGPVGGHTGLAIREVEADGRVGPGDDRVVFQGNDLLLRPGEVVRGAMVVHAVDAYASNGKPAIDVLLSSEGRERLAEITRRNRGRQIAILVDGKMIAAPLISDPIENGAMQLSSDFDQHGAQQLAQAIRGGAGLGY